MNRHSVWCDRKLADLMFRCPFVNEHHYRRPLLSVSYFLHPFLRFLATETRRRLIDPRVCSVLMCGLARSVEKKDQPREGSKKKKL